MNSVVACLARSRSFPEGEQFLDDCITLSAPDLFLCGIACNGRGAQDAEEKTVSVRWDAAPSTIRGPYYTGAQDRDGKATYDLIAEPGVPSSSNNAASSTEHADAMGAKHEQTKTKRLYNHVPLPTAEED